jgi:hypothetical protein
VATVKITWFSGLEVLKGRQIQPAKQQDPMFPVGPIEMLRNCHRIVIGENTHRFFNALADPGRVSVIQK